MYYIQIKITPQNGFLFSLLVIEDVLIWATAENVHIHVYGIVLFSREERNGILIASMLAASSVLHCALPECPLWTWMLGTACLSCSHRCFNPGDSREYPMYDIVLYLKGRKERYPDSIVNGRFFCFSSCTSELDMDAWAPQKGWLASPLVISDVSIWETAENVPTHM